MTSAREDRVIPLQDPICDIDGRLLSEIFVPKGTEVICNIEAVNTDVKIWGSDAHEWNPERWLSPLPQTNIPGVLANTYAPRDCIGAFCGLHPYRLTFSGGGRACMLVVYATLLAGYELIASL